MLADRLVDASDGAIRSVIRRRGPAVVTAVEALRREHPGRSPERLAHAAVTRRAARLAGSGALSALPAMLPGPGTAVEVGAALGDVSLLTAAQVELVLQIAHIYGRPPDDHDARRLDVLMVHGMDVGAVRLRRGGAVEAMGVTYRREELHGTPADALSRLIAGRLAAEVAVRLARRRAHVILGREIPLIGIGVAAGYNLQSTRAIGRGAVRYFEHIA
jgi:uncharacterized protein (DUF697 family)